MLDPAGFGSDVEDFDAALADRRHADAAELCTGPFMDGVHIGESAAFDHWLDEQRAAYARRYRTTLEALAEACEAEGDLSAAVDAWSRLAAEDHFDSRIALRLLLALDAAGNRPGALRFARVHEQLLDQEFGTEPDPTFLEAAKRLKEGTAAPRQEQPAGREGPAAGPAARPPEGSPAAGGPPGPPALAAGVGDTGGADRGLAAALRTRRAAAGAGGREGGTASIVRPAVIIALILGAAGFGGYLASRGVGAATPTGVLVLPFEAPDSGDVAFAEGLSEEIMEALGSANGVRVPARSTALSLRDEEAREAARRIGVDYVLEGTVRRQGDRLRVRVQLSGADGFVTWYESYDRPAGAPFDTWEEIALAVLNALEVKLGWQRLATALGGTDSTMAYEWYVRGRHSWFKRTPEGLRQAIAYFQQAIDVDPRYARAYTGIADAYNLMGAYDYGLLRPDSAFPLARAAAERALVLEPRLAEAHAALGQALFAYEGNLAAAHRSFRRAIRHNPRYAEAHHWHGLLLTADGKPEEGLAAARRATELDPLSPVMKAGLARQLYFHGEHEAALAGYQEALELEPSFLTAYFGAGLPLLELGRYDDAVATFRRALGILGGPHPLGIALLGHAFGRAGMPDSARATLRSLETMDAAGVYVPAEYHGIIHLGLGDHDRAIAALRRSVDSRSGAVAYFGIDPMTRPLREDPRFRELVALPRR